MKNEIETAQEALTDVLASLVAAHSLLSRSPKTAAPSNKMFDTMLSDYAKSIKRGREALARLSPSTPVIDGARCASCDGTGVDLYDGTAHDCQVCNGRGDVPMQHGLKAALHPQSPAKPAAGEKEK